jgi:hypothetical protein
VAIVGQRVKYSSLWAVVALTSTGSRFFAREGAAAVVVVELSGSCVVVGPPAVTAQLDGLDKSVLLEVTLLASRLERFQPRHIGTASLSYRAAPPMERASVTTESAGPGCRLCRTCGQRWGGNRRRARPVTAEQVCFFR